MNDKIVHTQYVANSWMRVRKGTEFSIGLIHFESP